MIFKAKMIEFSLRSVTTILFIQLLAGCASETVLPCSINEEKKDPNLKEMSFDLGFGTEFFEAFVEPSIAIMSQGKYDKILKPDFQGHAAKFFNMSPNPVQLLWLDNQNQPSSMGTCKPFHSMGTASFAGHRFMFGPVDYEQSKVVLHHFTIDSNGSQNLYYYDPLTVEGDAVQTEKNLSTLTLPEYEKYSKMVRNRKFADEYFKFTGREYMAMYPREKPRHFMWPADHFGQVHWVTTRETHLHSLPSSNKLKRIRDFGGSRTLNYDQSRLLAEHRAPEKYLNMTLKVLSIRPRVYEIENFLSDIEVDHIVDYAKSANLKESTVGQDTNRGKAKVRTSFNTWVSRETNQVFDSIYRRAADLMRMDESLFRERSEEEIPDWPNRKSVAEDLQLVHYDIAQEYTAHHDFGYAAVDDELQPTRFATLLLYLNDPKKGGETEFPRWINGETTDGLLAKPEKGKAVLFYSFLPDGNLDDLSQHAAKPIIEGEKFLINLWVRDPIKNF